MPWFGESGPKHVQALDVPARRPTVDVPAATGVRRGSLSQSEDPSMSSFGEPGPTNVQVLDNPRRRPSQALAATGVRRDSDPLVAAEAGDHFEMTETLSLPQAGRKTFQAPISGGGTRPGIGIQRWNSSGSLGPSLATPTQRFAQPLAAEGHGSIFPDALPLSDRRALEVEIVRKFDRLGINSHVGEFWFIIDAIWVTNWIKFVMGNGPPPGPISNNNLFIQYPASRRESALVNHASSSRGGVMASRPDLILRDGLQKVRDYRAVHPLVWYIFREIYSADDSPEQCRWKPDIYMDDVQATRKFRFCDEMHTKAAYELRRVHSKIVEELKL